MAGGCSFYSFLEAHPPRRPRATARGRVHALGLDTEELARASPLDAGLSSAGVRARGLEERRSERSA